MSKDSKVSISIDKKRFNNYEEFIQFLNESLSIEVKSNESLKNQTIKLLGTAKALLVNGKHCDIYKCMLKGDLHQTLLDSIKLYISCNDVELFRAILSFLITITDNSDEMCNIFSKTELPFILMDLTLKVCSEDFKPNLPKSVTVESIVAQTILIIHNMARNDQYQQCFIQQENIKSFKDIIQSFLGSKDKRTSILVMAVLTWLAEDVDTDKKFLNWHSNIINNFIEYICKGVKDKSRWYEGLYVWELLQVLQALSCMSYIEHSIFWTPKFMLPILDILKSKSSLPKELELSLGILWNLSFSENNGEKLKSEYKVEDAVKGLTISENKQIRKKATDFLCHLSNQPGKEVSKKQSKYDIFISYCHAQNESVKKLVTELKKKFKVWIDTEGIQGSGLDDMAHGIQDSKVLMMAVSNSYKQSQCCRSEANWAYRLKKPMIPLLMERKYKPDGWLGMMMCTETYIDFSSLENLEESLRKIEEHIYHKCKVEDIVNITVTVTTAIGAESDRGALVQSKRCLEGVAQGETKAVKDWNREDVLQWLRANEMADMEPLFGDFNGKMILSMKQMRTEAYSDYLEHVKKELKLSFKQILQLDSAFLDLKL